MNGSHFAKQTQRERTCSLVHGSWKRAGARLACVGVCALMVGQLLLPSVALAADWINVGGTQYNGGAAVSDDAGTWSWNGADDMQLNGYNGGGISAEGNLNIGVTNTNTVTADAGQSAIEISGGNLSITGDGTLNATGQTDVITAAGNGIAGGDVTVDGATVNVAATGTDANGEECENAEAITAFGGDVTIKNGATVDVKAGRAAGSGDGYYGYVTGIYATNGAPGEDGEFAWEHDGQSNKGGRVSIGSGSTVTVKAESTLESQGIVSRVNNGAARVEIAGDSLVTAIADASNGMWGAVGIEAAGMGNDATADIIIDGKNTFVTAIASASKDRYSKDTYGLHTSSGSAVEGGSIQIKNGSVVAEGSDGAIVADNFTTANGPAGMIVIGEGGKIVLPVNGVVRDYQKLGARPMALGNRFEYSDFWGQTIGEPGEGVLRADRDADKIAKVAHIVFDGGATPAPDPAPTPKPQPGGEGSTGTTGATTQTSTQTGSAVNVKPAAAKVSVTASKATASTLAATGDSAALSVAAMSVAGATVAAAGIAAARRREE